MTEKKLEQKQPKDHKALAEKLQQYVAPRKDTLNSIALVTSPEGDIFESARGYADQLKSQPLTRDREAKFQFLAASVVKNFTAFALVTGFYREEEALGSSGDQRKQAIKRKLDRPLSFYLKPTDSIWDRRMPDWANEVTLHQLLTHTSGLPCFKHINEKATHELLKNPGPLSRFVNLFKDRVSRGIPCKKKNSYLYSNSNYLLAGYVAMQVLKSDPEKFLEDFFDPLFKTLGMHNTGCPSKKTLGDLRKEPRYKNLVFAHVVDLDQGGAVRIQYMDTVAKSKGKACFEEMFLPFASGNLVTTADDLAIWFRAICGGSPHIPAVVSEILKAEDSHIKTLRPHVYSCYGFVRHEEEGRIRCYELRGSTAAFSAAAVYFPEKEICYVELANMYRIGEAFNKLGDVRCDLTDIIDKPLRPAKQPKPSKKNWLIIAGGLAMVVLIHQLLNQKSAEGSTALITPSAVDLFGFFAGLTTLIGWTAVTPAPAPKLISETLEIEPVDKLELNPFVSKTPRDTCTIFSAPSGARTSQQEEAIRQDPAPSKSGMGLTHPE